ncbi:MAG: glycosyltransferase family 39 protein [Acidobacteriia bacterium]|nr:glycosyltransferase family 39 protein [Terriglobia bacterium]
MTRFNVGVKIPSMVDDAAPQPHFTEAFESLPRLATGLVIALCAAKLLLHLFTSVRHYGYFRDELYYLDLARHIDWGYVDCAPLIALYAKMALWLGGSLAALRILPALAGTVLVALSTLIARELGARRYAQLLTGLAVLLCPGVLVMDNLLTMNAFEPLFWMGCALIVARILRTGDSRLWVGFGVLAGLGLENKHSTLFFGFAVIVALFLTRHRREFLKPWIWIAGAIAVALFLPNVIWQVRHHFPTLEDLENVRREGKNVVLGPLAFTGQQIIAMHPILFPLWLLGLISFLKEARWRVLGLTFLVFFVSMEIAHAKDYYLFPIYPMLFAGGAIALERWRVARAAWVRVVVVVVILLGTVPTIPLATWMLSPERYLAYQEAIGFKPRKAEVHHEGLLPQPMGDQFGWPEMTREVAGIYNSLPPDERAQTGIFTGNYGEAGAINLFGPQYGLPRAYSRHQNHWYWGPPTEHYKNLIVVQWSRDDVQDNCASWQAFDHYQRFGMGEENTPIYLCRGAQFDLQKIWWHSKHWN